MSVCQCENEGVIVQQMERADAQRRDNVRSKIWDIEKVEK